MFEYKVTTPDGEVHTMRFEHLAAKVPAGIFRRNMDDDERRMWEMLEWGVGPDQLALLDWIPMDELPEVIEQWEKFDGITAGKSPASSASSTSTARPSKPTSSS